MVNHQILTTTELTSAGRRDMVIKLSKRIDQEALRGPKVLQVNGQRCISVVDQLG